MSTIEPGVIFQIDSINITNTMLAGFLTFIIMLIVAVGIRLSLSVRPNTFQAFIEILYEYIYSLTESISDKKRAEIFFPWIMGFFIFILISNYMGLIPIFGEAILYKDNHNFVEQTNLKINENDYNDDEYQKESHEEGYPLLRGATTDMNYTFALSLISFILIIGYGIIMQNPVKFVLHYFQANELNAMEKGMRFAMLPIFIFVGILEIFLEPLKSIALSFRLFGNVYAGETLIYAMSTIIGGSPTLFIAVPFYLLEFLVAFIQALVFSILTLTFLSLTTKH